MGHQLSFCVLKVENKTFIKVRKKGASLHN